MCFRPPNATIQCPECGAEVGPLDDACPACGATASTAGFRPSSAPGAPKPPAGPSAPKPPAGPSTRP